MPKLTEIRHALTKALPDDVKGEVIVGPTKGPRTFGRGEEAQLMIIRIYVGSPTDAVAQERLDQLLEHEDPQSLCEALHSDEDLGDVVESLTITGTSGWRTFQAKDSPPLLGAEWTLEVTA